MLEVTGLAAGYLGERVIILSSSPTVIQEDITVDLPADRDQLNTRSLPRFTELRHHVYEQIQLAKKGHRPAAAGTPDASSTPAAASGADVA